MLHIIRELHECSSLALQIQQGYLMYYIQIFTQQSRTSQKMSPLDLLMGLRVDCKGQVDGVSEIEHIWKYILSE
jgi:hypothetical protein